MTERINRRDQIIDVASRLFMTLGYSATSVRQIAEEVGCTEAALYYHFKEGKRELLEAVVQCNVPNLIESVEACAGTESLHEFIVCFTRSMASKAASEINERVRWLLAEFPKLTEDEKTLLSSKHEAFRMAIEAQIRRFVPDDAEVEFIASTLVLALVGYSFMAVTISTAPYIHFELDMFLPMLADRLAQGR